MIVFLRVVLKRDVEKLVSKGLMINGNPSLSCEASGKIFQVNETTHS